MFLLRVFLAFLVGVNLIFLFFANYSTRRMATTVDNHLDDSTPTQPEQIYQFKDPTLAYLILKKLDILEPEYIRVFPYVKTFLGLTADDSYCDKHRADFVFNPGYIFTEKNHMTSYSSPNGFRKIVLGVMGKNVMPTITEKDTNETDKNRVDLAVNVSLYATQYEMYNYRSIMRQFSCLTQMSNHIPGHDSINRKDMASKNLLEYSRQYQTRPHCFNLDKFFPKTYSLQDREQCNQFFNMFNSQLYQDLKKQRNIVYFRKIGADLHAAQGVFPVDKEQEELLQDMYKGGKLCGQVTKNNLMQYYVHNPLLLNGHKFDFRIFMLLASSNPFIAYYHDGFLRVSLTKYSTGEDAYKSLMPNGHSNDEMIIIAKTEGTYNGKTEFEIKDDYYWSFDRLQTYLLDKGYTKDPKWLDNYLRPQFKKAMVHLIRMSQHTFHKISSVFELLGVDFMLDEELNIWFVEANCRPAIEAVNPMLQKFFVKMFLDHYEIAFAVLRSRVKRIYTYVNNLIDSDQYIRLSENEVFIKELDKKIGEFKEITKNRIDPEFAISPENGFVKIMDENEKGTKVYADLLPEECL